MILVLINKITLQEYSIEVTDLETSTLFYHFQTDFKGLDDGEYRYELYSDGGKIVSTGLMTIGEYVSKETEYNEEKEYIQYEG